MRTIRIIRPKMMMLAAKKLHVLLDGAKAGTLSNGKELTLSLDENGHEITLNGGAFSSKKLTCSRYIPQGNHSYCYQTGFVPENNMDGEQPILRPCGGSVLPEDPAKLRCMIGVTLTGILMDEKTRAEMRANPDERIGLYLEENSWKVTFERAGARTVVFEQEYSSSGTAGFLLGSLNNSIQKGLIATPEDRASTLAFLFDNYFAFLPDYEISGDHLLCFLG